MRPVRTLEEIEADLKSSSSTDFIARGRERIRARQADLAELALTRWRARCGPVDEAALVRAAKTALRLPPQRDPPPLLRGWDLWGNAGAPARRSAILDRLGYLLGWLEVWHEAAFEVIGDAGRSSGSGAIASARPRPGALARASKARRDSANADILASLRADNLERLSSLPHPRGFAGKSALDWLDYMIAHCGAAGRARVVRDLQALLA